MTGQKKSTSAISIAKLKERLADLKRHQYPFAKAGQATVWDDEIEALEKQIAAESTGEKLEVTDGT